MSTIYISDRSELTARLEELAPGDCVLIDRFSDIASGSGEFVSVAEKLSARQVDLRSAEEGLDTTGAKGEFFFKLCRELAQLDRADRDERRREGIARSKEDGKYKGRKPIAVDQSLFDAVAERWRSGEITARQAMRELDLKPNTFYRRIKEREEQKMKEYKEVEKTIRSEIKETNKQARQAMDDLKKQVRSEAKDLKAQVRSEAHELKKAAGEQLDAHEVQREIRHDRIRAELEHTEDVRQMKKDLAAETAELKKLLSDEG